MLYFYYLCLKLARISSVKQIILLVASKNFGTKKATGCDRISPEFMNITKQFGSLESKAHAFSAADHNVLLSLFILFDFGNK